MEDVVYITSSLNGRHGLYHIITQWKMWSISHLSLLFRTFTGSHFELGQPGRPDYIFKSPPEGGFEPMTIELVGNHASQCATTAPLKIWVPGNFLDSKVVAITLTTL